MSNEIMLDLETLGVEPGCVVLSIGATDGFHEFECTIDIEDSCSKGLVIEPRTTLWWLEQSEDARKAICKPGEELHAALIRLVGTFDWKNKRVWCNGASFDFPILKVAMSKVGMKLPWPYYSEMDFRTLKNLVTKETFDKLRVRPTIAHNALEDARAQHSTLMNLLNYLEQHPVQMCRAA